ncbi:uncharacterized protein LOC123860119 isoform X1 [Mirounga angustirostris]|uniref:uncharacterized protein LOC123860119 isoform X1 n=1 Tax=Mirounga angustirostris TaxID=9716 RepID=UPI00313E0F7D
MILYNRKKVKYRKDGYCWKKRKDGKTTREDHMKLKVQGVECLYGCYVHSSIIPTFHRRCYWLLQVGGWEILLPSLVLGNVCGSCAGVGLLCAVAWGRGAPASFPRGVGVWLAWCVVRCQEGEKPGGGAGLSCPRRIKPHQGLPGCLSFLLMRTEVRLSILLLTANCLWAESCTVIFSCGLVGRWHLWKIGSRRHASDSRIDWNGCWARRSPRLCRKEPGSQFMMSALPWDGEGGGGAPRPHQGGLAASSVSGVLVCSWLGQAGLSAVAAQPLPGWWSSVVILPRRGCSRVSGKVRGIHLPGWTGVL